MKKRYNTMLDMAFSIEHDYEDPADIPREQLLAALLRRVAEIISGDSEVGLVGEAFGECDTYEIEDDDA